MKLFNTIIYLLCLTFAEINFIPKGSNGSSKIGRDNSFDDAFSLQGNFLFAGLNTGISSRYMYIVTQFSIVIREYRMLNHYQNRTTIIFLRDIYIYMSERIRKNVDNIYTSNKEVRFIIFPRK